MGYDIGGELLSILSTLPTIKKLNITNSSLARELFHGSSKGNDFVLVSLMESSADDPERAWAEAMQARLEDDIHIIAVGIGENIHRDELESIASFPVIRNVRTESYDTLFFLQHYLIETICNSK